ncbi:hypothetical protein BD289DRAFT_439170 [Coniella lustricola]|uniref:MARVEL domain-containing protein n=1 Tax=Coniella lustricola TaxID=2025994 RepID=A0A2T3A216_9PEZI|nr:hypothetical protein BD289DRAFT_439170 [Coniella lustricola]
MSRPAASLQAPPQAVLNEDAGHTPQAGTPYSQPLKPFSVPKPAPFQTSRTFVIGKLVLAGCTFLFAIITLGLAVAMAVAWPAYISMIAAVIVAIVAGVSAIWQFADGLTMLVRRSIHRPIHPGAHVGVRLILSIIGAIAISSVGISLAVSLGNWTVDPNCYDGSYWSDSGAYEADVYCGTYDFATTAAARAYFGTLEALMAFAVLMWAGEVTLFVLACVETHRRRKHGKMTRIVYVMADGTPAHIVSPSQYQQYQQPHAGVAAPQPVAKTGYA